MSWADIKAAARRSVHETFRRAATYAGPDTVDGSVECYVRWHPAGATVGALGGQSNGYAEVVTTTDRIVFDAEDLDVTPEKGGTVTLASGESFVLDVQAEPDGPVTDVWMVTRA